MTVGDARKGLFVVLEGPDGVGKSSVAKRLLEEVRGVQGIPATLDAEPTRYGPFGKLVRERLTGTPAGRLTMLFGMLADRAWHIEEVIKPALAAGGVFICDRYTLSTHVYQGVVEGFPMDFLCMAGWQFPEPDLTILLDAPLEVCQQRMAAAGRSQERYEGNESLAKAVAAYHHIATWTPGYRGDDRPDLWFGACRPAPRLPGNLSRVRAVDATQPLEDVVAACIRLVDEARAIKEG